MKEKFYGLSWVILLSIITIMIEQSGLLQILHLSSLIIAILFGMLLANTYYPKIALKANAGVGFAKGKLLQIGIILYGFRITLQQIDQVGINAIVTDIIMLISTFFLTLYVGYRYLKIDKQTVILSAAGCSICGAAAVMATEPLLKAPAHKVSVAIAIVVIFGTLAMFIYPLLYPWLNGFLTNFQYGVYIGSSVHEVAQVVAAGHAISTEIGDTAVISKMIRVLMLAPFLLVLSYAVQDSKTSKRQINIPWFAIWFLIVTVIHSSGILPSQLINVFIIIDQILLIMAMTALGMATQIQSLRKAGIKPFILGAIVFIWLLFGGFSVNFIISKIF